MWLASLSHFVPGKYLDNSAVAGYLPTTESHLWAALGVKVCELLLSSDLQNACKDVVYRLLQQDVLGTCSAVTRNVT